MPALLEGLPGSLAVAVASRVGPLLIVPVQPGVQVHLQLLQAAVQLLPEEQAVAFVLQGLVEPFADAVGLGVIGLGSGMVDVLHCQVQLVGVVLRFPPLAGTALGAPVSEDALQPDALFVKEEDYSVIEQVRRGDGALVGVEPGSGHPAEARAKCAGRSAGRSGLPPLWYPHSRCPGRPGVYVEAGCSVSISPWASFSCLAFSRDASRLSVRIRPPWTTLCQWRRNSGPRGRIDCLMFRKKFYRSLEKLHVDLDAKLDRSNNERSHSGTLLLRQDPQRRSSKAGIWPWKKT